LNPKNPGARFVAPTFDWGELTLRLPERLIKSENWCGAALHLNLAEQAQVPLRFVQQKVPRGKDLMRFARSCEIKKPAGFRMICTVT